MPNFGFFCHFIIPTLIGLLDIFTDILYILIQSFYRNDLFLACFYCQFTLFFGGLLFYIYVHLQDVSSTNLSYSRIVLRSFELTTLTELKLAHFAPRLWDIEEDPEFEFNDIFRAKIVGIQEALHTLLQAVPQICIQTLNNSLMGEWNALSWISLGFSGVFVSKIIYRIVVGCCFREKNGMKGIYMEL